LSTCPLPLPVPAPDGGERAPCLAAARVRPRLDALPAAAVVVLAVPPGPVLRLPYGGAVDVVVHVEDVGAVVPAPVVVGVIVIVPVTVAVTMAMAVSVTVSVPVGR